MSALIGGAGVASPIFFRRFMHALEQSSWQWRYTLRATWKVPAPTLQA
jgi:hypothetical protein